MRMTEPCASRTWPRKSGATAVAAALLLGSMPMGTAIAQTASAARFRGEARAASTDEAALSNLLNIIGRREGAKSIISIG